MGLREQILAADDRTRVKVEVPESWGKTLYVSSMTGTERDSFEARIEAVKQLDPDAPRNVRSLLVVLTCCDKAGERVFKDDDVELLGKKSGAVLDLLFSESVTLNRLNTLEIESAEKN